MRNSSSILALILGIGIYGLGPIIMTSGPFAATVALADNGSDDGADHDSGGDHGHGGNSGHSDNSGSGHGGDGHDDDDDSSSNSGGDDGTADQGGGNDDDCNDMRCEAEKHRSSNH
jgi:hypothetical protein